MLGRRRRRLLSGVADGKQAKTQVRNTLLGNVLALTGAVILGISHSTGSATSATCIGTLGKGWAGERMPQGHQLSLLGPPLGLHLSSLKAPLTQKSQLQGWQALLSYELSWPPSQPCWQATTMKSPPGRESSMHLKKSNELRCRRSQATPSSRGSWQRSDPTRSSMQKMQKHLCTQRPDWQQPKSSR
jgi:hypothetical protein